MTSIKYIARYLIRITQLMFVYLALFLRHYTLKRTVVKAEDVEKAGLPVKLDQGNGDELFEEGTNEPSNNKGDNVLETVDVEKKGHEV